ncbi:MAG: Sec-independent protein translocase protein TatB [Pseudomonadota bacterium]
MFDIGWSELLVLGIVALIVIGPKDLPIVLRTIGRYAGMIRKQAAEFRAQFEEVIRDSEYETIRKEMDALGKDVGSSVREATAGLEKDLDEARRALDAPATPEAGADSATDGESPKPGESPAATEPAASETAGEGRALAESGAVGGKAG